jgi:hypothetical protein
MVTLLDWVILAVIVALILIGGAALWLMDRRRR